MSNVEAFTLAKRKARYGHRDWLVWRTRAGAYRAEPMSAESIKGAMLDTGSQDAFFRICADTALTWNVRWRTALTMLRNARLGYC